MLSHNITASFNALPDWKTHSVYFAWPRGLYGRNLLVNAYRDIIRFIPPDIEIHVILNDNSYQDSIIKTIRKVRPDVSILFHTISGLKDIWIKDWAPIPLLVSEKETVLLKATYNPQYLSGKYAHYATADNQSGSELSSILNLQIIDLPIVWDIGNFTHNGIGTAIVTRRIMDDNPLLTENDIAFQFQDKLGINTLILIDTEPGDPTGHVDGTVRFLSEKVVAVAVYPEDHINENRFCNDLAEMLSSTLGGDYHIIRIPNGPIDDYEIEGFPSVVGNHLNFLRIGKHLLMPCYGIPEDNLAIEAINNYCADINVIPVTSKEIVTLARRGGVLDCISWGL